MTARKSTTNVTSLAGALDALIGSPRRWLMGSGARRTTVLGIVAASVLAAVMIPFRDDVGTANIALMLAIVVALVGGQAGLGPGIICALWAGGLFALLHSVPHGLPRVEDAQDALTAVLLVATGALSGWARERRAALKRRLRAGKDDIARLHLVGALAARTSAEEMRPEEFMSALVDEISSELGLEECRWSPGAARPPRLLESGIIEGDIDHTDPREIGAALGRGVAIDLGRGGHLMLIGRPDGTATRHELKVAVLLADYAAAALNPVS